MEPITAKQLINNLIAKSEPYIVDDTSNIDIFILDIQGNITNILPTHKIIINDHTYYYTLTSNNWIYLYNNIDFDKVFSEKDSDKTWYGDHFSFGYSNEFPDILNFHLTSYHFDMRSHQTKRTSIYCDFKISDFINDSKNPKCTARKSNTYLTTTFDSIFSEDVAYIKDIISFGLTQEKIIIGPDEFLYKGKVYKIQTGPKGGLFIMVPKLDGTLKRKAISKDLLEYSQTENTENTDTSAPLTVPYTNLPVLGDSPVQSTQQPHYNTRSSKNKDTQNGGGIYTYKFQNLLSHFILKYSKDNKIKLQDDTYVFIKQSTNHMIILFNYMLVSTDSKDTKQYILNVNTQLINKYLSPPGIKTTNVYKNKLVYV